MGLRRGWECWLCWREGGSELSFFRVVQLVRHVYTESSCFGEDMIVILLPHQK